MIPLAAAFAVLIFCFFVDGFDLVSLDFVNPISTIMAIASLFVGLSALFCRYKSRLAAGLFVFGSILLAYVWASKSL